MFFYSKSLACFLPRAFVLISWPDTLLHFVVTHSILWDMFIDHYFTMYTYHGLSTSFFCLIFLGFSNAPTPFTVHSSWPLSVESLKGFTIGNPLGCQGSACVEVMTTLHGSALSLQRCARGCVPPEGTIASVRDLLKSTHLILGPPWPVGWA